MTIEYRDVILAGESLLEELTGYHWDHGTTGGGCDAFFLNTNDEKNSYFMVTVSDDASIPTNEEEWKTVTVGLYDDDDDEGTYVVVGDTEDIRVYFSALREVVETI